MKLFENVHIFDHAWYKVSAANWIKYPNEITSHVINVDYLDRSVDPETGILRTVRLITCRQSMPLLIAKFFGGDSTAYVYEVSEVDARNQTLTLRARNMTFSDIMTIEETCKYTRAPGADADSKTVFRQEACIKSNISFSKIEDFCLSRFQSNASKGRAALESILNKIHDLHPHFSLPASMSAVSTAPMSGSSNAN
jgi:hypothetical protein